MNKLFNILGYTRVYTGRNEKSSFAKEMYRQAFLRYKKLKMTRPPHPVRPLKNMVELGTDYGGFVIPDNLLHEKSVCYLAGAGEDISFDIALAERYGSEVHIFDPTPRAKAHFEQLIAQASRGQTIPINNRSEQSYNLKPENIKRLHYHNLGLWNKEEEVKFFSPKDEAHVSHSITNIQNTTDYFMAKVKRLSQVMEELGHTEIDVFKLNIEGAEYEVLKSIREDHVAIKMICIIFDEMNIYTDGDHYSRIHQAILDLVKFGFEVIHMDFNYNTTFLRRDVFDKLKKA